jgi:hypothetical protein
VPPWETQFDTDVRSRPLDDVTRLRPALRCPVLPVLTVEPTEVMVSLSELCSSLGWLEYTPSHTLWTSRCGPEPAKDSVVNLHFTSEKLHFLGCDVMVASPAVP